MGDSLGRCVGCTMLTGGVGRISGSAVGVFCLMQRVPGRSQRGAAVPPLGGNRSARQAAKPANDAAAPAVIGHAQHATVSPG
ncbi:MULTISPECIES: hypothetical protein [Ralstonia]|nr:MULTISPECIES: hypothetical protein [Ralstonia]MBY4705407.1 hypothetical protein [Ralstonia insidiosa]